MDAEENKAGEIVSVGASEVVAVDSEVVAVDVKEVVDADGHARKVVTTTKRVTTTKHADAADAASAPEAAVRKAAGPLAAYEAWVNSHASLARNVETMLYIAPQLVPKRVVSQEVATQTGYSLVGLLHLYHDYVLYKATAVEEPSTVSQQIVRATRVPLSIISHIQVLAEVIAGKVGGDVSKWKLIVSLEVVKSVLRVLLLIQQRRAMLVRGGKYKGVESAPRPSAFARFTKKAPKQGSRTGKTFGKATPAAEATPAPEDPTPAVNTISFPDATLAVADATREDLLIGGELCHIFRPVVYAILRQRQSETSWTPVIASLAVELAGLALSSAAVKASSSPAPAAEPASSTKMAQDEISARKMALLLYLLRDPVYENVTMPATGQAADVLDYVPVVGKVFRFASTAILGYYHQFHFYTSAS